MAGGTALVAASAVLPRVALLGGVPAAAVLALMPGMEVPALGAVALMQVGIVLRCGRHLPKLRSIAVIAFAGLLVFSLVRGGGGFAVDSTTARNHLAATLIAFGLVLAVMAVRPSKTELLRSLAVSGIVSCWYLTDVGALAAGRLATEAFNANTMGHIAGLALVATLGAFVSTGGVWWLVGAAPAALLLILSQSRGALLVVVIGVGIPWVFRRLSAGRVVLAATTSAGLYLAWPFVSSVIAALLSARVHQESDTRVDLLRIAGRAIVEHPVAGIGWRTFPDYSERLLGRGFNTHNEYLRLAAEAGLPALAALALLLWWALRAPIGDRSDWAMKSLLLAGLTSLAFANSMSSLAICTPIWFAVGALLIESRNPTDDSPPASVGSAEGDDRPPATRQELDDRTQVALRALTPRPPKPLVPAPYRGPRPGN